MRLRRAHLEVVLALGADIQVGLKIGFPNSLPAAQALDPKAFGTNALFSAVARLVFAVLSLEPGHNIFANCKWAVGVSDWLARYQAQFSCINRQRPPLCCEQATSDAPDRKRLMPAVIGVSGKDCKSPVELLGDYQARQSVGQGHRSE